MYCLFAQGEDGVFVMSFTLYVLAAVVKSNPRGDWTKYWWIGVPALLLVFGSVYWLLFFERGDTGEAEPDQRQRGS